MMLFGWCSERRHAEVRCDRDDATTAHAYTKVQQSQTYQRVGRRAVLEVVVLVLRDRDGVALRQVAFDRVFVRFHAEFTGWGPGCGRPDRGLSGHGLVALRVARSPGLLDDVILTS